MPRSPHLPPVETRWQKGKSGNPSGKPKNVFTSEELRKKIGKTLALSKAQLAEILQDNKSSVLDLVLASVAAKCIKDGDIAKMEFLFNRSLGKVKDIVNLQTQDTQLMERERIRAMSTEELTAFVLEKGKE